MFNNSGAATSKLQDPNLDIHKSVPLEPGTGSATAADRNCDIYYAAKTELFSCSHSIAAFRPSALTPIHTLVIHVRIFMHIEQETVERRRRQRPAWTATDAVHADDNCSFPVVGSGGSRLLSGNSWYAEELEQWIARFHKRPSALLFNSGYDANLGLMSCLPQPGDAVVCDELVHNSVRVSWPPFARH